MLSMGVMKNDVMLKQRIADVNVSYVMQYAFAGSLGLTRSLCLRGD